MSIDDEISSSDGIERTVIDTLIDLREERGWSQSELARRVVEAGLPKYTQMTVSRTEKGERPIRLNEAQVLANVFGVELYELWSPRELRLLTTAMTQVQRLGGELEKAISSYLDAQRVLARRADNVNLATEEVSLVAAQLMDTPESIAARVRATGASDFKSYIDQSEVNKTPKERAAEERFWSKPDGERRLVDLYRELNGVDPEEA